MELILSELHKDIFKNTNYKITADKLHAKNLLIEKEEQAISDFCYASGFDNLSNLNRKFKSITSMIHKEFRSQYLN